MRLSFLSSAALASAAPSRRLRRAALAALAVAVCAGGTAGVTPPPADEAAGLAATFEQALAEGSNAALIAFIARYPDAQEADAARRVLAGREALDPVAASGPDGDVIMAFDAARLQRSEAAMRDFAERFPGHPLAAEARNPFWAP